MSYDPNDYGGEGESGTVTVIPVMAILFADKVEGPIPLTVHFASFGEGIDEDSGSPTFGETIPVSSAGTEMVLTIGDTSVRVEGNTGTWTYTFREEGEFTVLLTAIGGTSIDSDSITINALPPLPEQSANLIIRAMSITATAQQDPQIGTTDGDQI